MVRMMISYDTEAQAYHVTLTDAEVNRTVHVSDWVLVDIDTEGRAIGIELLAAPSALNDQEKTELFRRFPEAAPALSELERLMPLSA
jgi:uncharacterized protein YuzE